MEDKRNNQASESSRDDLICNRSNDGEMPAIPKLLLASASPRRAEILRTVGWPFETLAVDIDESRRAGETAASYVERLALAKAEAAALLRPDSMIVGADTVVVIQDAILGKPHDEDDARRMLRLLNDLWHQVLTGVAVFNSVAAESKVAHETTEVKFAAMTDDEIAWYVSTGEPMDKAGAYAIQGRGARFIEEIKGDYFNVVGLPVRQLYKLMNEFRSE
ncbi:MAG TPA: Maf family protein [Pyrinomonadaceae bacterium]|nr:Maf family protein [Pyrinomonadaceae bacterium]